MPEERMEPRVHDVIGIGFGPSNLALAVALDEARERDGGGVDAVFFEKQPEFGWHRGMLIDGATMQVHFLKDLVSLRNPASRFSFLAYLHARGRLVDFVNHKTMFPTRVEFHDYLEWTAAAFADRVRYGTEVVALRPRDEEVLEVVVRRDDRLETHLARNVVIGVGLEPSLPEGVQTGERIWHTEDLLTRLGERGDWNPRRLVVVGAGQSAAEAVEYLHRTFTETEVCAVFARYGYSPADDSAFANRIFDPAAVDHYYAAPDDVKRMLLEYSRNTNYSVVDLDLIDELYRRAYAERVAGAERLRILNVSRLLDVRDGPGGVRVTVGFLPTGETADLDADALVYATGYRERDPFGLLGEAGGDCLAGPDGRPVVERDYRIATRPGRAWSVYLQGATEHSHGIASSLLSMTAVRTGEIVRSIAGRSARIVQEAR
ncbi:lysine N(6)-hydroxylase/L-ornithine N(5)-oxygenase family protein [Actinomadura bangladeshensis]|uniref:L-lysine N6-monooxygenase MbtG n=1 Tax=Actinomadura bangladeshensis TaxID=453573 RepID=A0A4R4NZV8_9ACTN|nr:lysine N(6)-hydroxylase/L-ornithine N(5)-oxygenase family protein [Actinomadura bangladeshensis]TDC13132.1 L-lysine 6-monooxygenase [Actinomadura bangladeshensis]